MGLLEIRNLAVEGLGAPRTILPASLLLLGGQVMPFLLLGVGLAGGMGTAAVGLAAVGSALALLPRLLAAWRFRQPLGGALLHPLGVLWLLAVQWYALGRLVAGRPAGWKGRTYAAVTRGSGA